VRSLAVLDGAFGLDVRHRRDGYEYREGAMTQRTDRIDALLREEVGAILSREIADPPIGFVTVTDVETAPDLSHASLWVSLIGQPDERAESLAALRRALPFIRHELGRRVRLRRIPELHLRVDDTAQRGTRILQLLTELEAGQEPEPDAVIDESLPTPIGRSTEPEAGSAPRPAGRRPGRPRPGSSFGKGRGDRQKRGRR
jgi:ribosome-binding factor A